MNEQPEIHKVTQDPQLKRIEDLLESILQELRQNKPAKIGVIEGGTGKPVLTVDDEPLRG